MSGGEMIQSVALEKTSFNALPWKFEAGTPAIVECVGLGAAIDYLEAIGMDAIAAHEAEITAYAYERLSAVEGLTHPRPARGRARRRRSRSRSRPRTRTTSRRSSTAAASACAPGTTAPSR